MYTCNYKASAVSGLSANHLKMTGSLAALHEDQTGKTAVLPNSVEEIWLVNSYLTTEKIFVPPPLNLGLELALPEYR